MLTVSIKLVDESEGIFRVESGDENLETGTLSELRQSLDEEVASAAASYAAELEASPQN